MSDKHQLQDLVDRFERNLDAYKSGQYNETQLRREFLDPLFKLLGWDMDNEQGYAEAYKDVIHEDAIKIGGATKAPDYSFRIGISLNQQLVGARLDEERRRLNRQISALDKQIDQLVYELYGLTEDEIRIVEESMAEKG
jgi:hypothetical protein